MACQDIDECDLFGNKTCGKNTCVNVVGTYHCECQDENDESVGGKICTHKFWYGTKGIHHSESVDNEKEDRRNQIKLPDDPVVMVTVIALSLWIIGFYVYVALMMCYTVAMAFYLFVTTEPVDDEDDIEDGDEKEDEDDDVSEDDDEGQDEGDDHEDDIDLEVGGTQISSRRPTLFNAAVHMFSFLSRSQLKLSPMRSGGTTPTKYQSRLYLPDESSSSSSSTSSSSS